MGTLNTLWAVETSSHGMETTDRVFLPSLAYQRELKIELDAEIRTMPTSRGALLRLGLFIGINYSRWWYLSKWFKFPKLWLHDLADSFASFLGRKSSFFDLCWWMLMFQEDL